MSDDLAEAVRTFVRYESPDDKGETRRQRNARFGQPSPDIEYPDECEHVWQWFWEISARRRSGPEAITYAEVGEWQRLTGRQIRPEEVDMIMRMDDAFVSAAREEQRAEAERARAAAEMGRR